jgi:hypothetical protein
MLQLPRLLLGQFDHHCLHSGVADVQSSEQLAHQRPGFSGRLVLRLVWRGRHGAISNLRLNYVMAVRCFSSPNVGQERVQVEAELCRMGFARRPNLFQNFITPHRLPFSSSSGVAMMGDRNPAAAQAAAMRSR